MFPVQLSCVVSLLNVFLVRLPNFCLQLFGTIPVAPVITGIFGVSLYITLVFLFLFCFLLLDISVRWYCLLLLLPQQIKLLSTFGYQNRNYSDTSANE